MSSDKSEKSAAFKREIGAEFSFVADRAGKLIRLYGVKTPLVTFARRYTFIIGKERKIVHVDNGGSAIDTSGALEACSLY